MRLPALHLFERAHPRVLVVEPDHEAERHLVVFQVVQEAAAESGGVHRPAGGVHDEARLRLRRIDLPQLLDADGPALRIASFVELEPGQQRLAQMSACAFGKDRVLGVQLHAELEVLGRLSVLADAEVAGGHALHRAVVVVEHFGRRKAGKDLDAERFGLLRHPPHDVAEADDVIALVVHRQGHEPVGRAVCALRGEEQDVVAGHRLVQRRAELLPVRYQLGDRSRVHHRARQDVRAGLGSFLEHDHRHFLAVLGGELLHPDRRRQARRSGAHHDDVVLHRLARAVLREDLLRTHGFSFVTGRKLAAILRAPSGPLLSRRRRHDVAKLRELHAILASASG